MLWSTIVIPENTKKAIERFDIRGASQGLDLLGTGELKDCVIAENRIGVRTLVRNNSSCFQNCLIANNLSDGIQMGITRIKLEHCTIANNGGIGINLTYYGHLELNSCTITGNQVGVKSKLYTTHLDMKGCNIAGNRQAAIEVQTNDDFQCQGNYWGTSNAAQIASSILDGIDKPGLGIVRFDDYAKKPIKDAGCTLIIKQ